MTQTVEITEQFGDAGGPLENVLVTAELVVPGGIQRAGMTAAPRYSARTDTDGELILSLPPNTNTLSQSWYVFSAWHPNTGDKIIDNVSGVVPGYSVTLTDILSRNPNPVSRAVKTAETALTRSAHDAAMDLVQAMPDSYSKRQMKAQLAVVNLRIWPYTQQKRIEAIDLVASLSSGANKSQLQSSISAFTQFVDAYHAASVASHTKLQLDRNTAQALLNAAPYGEQYDLARANVQSLLESVVITPRFSAAPSMSDQGDAAELISGAHPFISSDGLAIRNPGQNIFGFLSTISIAAGSGWHAVEFDLAAGYALESFVGVGDSGYFNSAMDGIFLDSGISIGFDIR